MYNFLGRRVYVCKFSIVWSAYFIKKYAYKIFIFGRHKIGNTL